MVDFNKQLRIARLARAPMPPPAPSPPSPEESPSKAPFRPGKQAPWSSRTTTHTARGGKKTVVMHEEQAPVTPGTGPATGGAMASMSLQVTIPGPPLSYMSTVIRVGLTMPAGCAPEEVQETYRLIEGLIKERLEQESKAVQDHYASLFR